MVAIACFWNLIVILCPFPLWDIMAIVSTLAPHPPLNLSFMEIYRLALNIEILERTEMHLWNPRSLFALRYNLQEAYQVQFRLLQKSYTVFAISCCAVTLDPMGGNSLLVLTSGGISGGSAADTWFITLFCLCWSAALHMAVSYDICVWDLMGPGCQGVCPPITISYKPTATLLLYLEGVSIMSPCLLVFFLKNKLRKRMWGTVSEYLQ